jgi:hypothetical protein
MVQLGHRHFALNRPVLPDAWMGDVYSGLALQTLRCVASCVERKLLVTSAQKSNTAPVSDAHKKVHVQGKRLGTREYPATASVLIAELDFVRSATDDLTQFLTIKQHDS